MKKLLSLLLVLTVLFLGFAPAAAAVSSSAVPKSTATDLDLGDFSATSGFSFDFLPATSQWKNLVGAEQPAKLTAQYTLKDNVKIVSDAVAKDIKSAGQILSNSAVNTKSPMQIVAGGGYINRTVLQNAAGMTETVQPGTVFLNETSGTAFKIVAPMDEGEATAPYKDTYAVTKPQISEIVDDFRIEETKIDLNKANIDSFASQTVEDCIVQPGQSQVMSGGDNYTSFRYLQNPLIKFVFPEGTTLKGSLGDGMEVTVKLNGGLAIGDLGLEADYSGFDGYRFALLASEESYLSVDVGIAVNQEIRIPILGLDIPFGVGRVTGGLFLIVGMDGKVTIQIRAREYISSKMGIKGDTFLYVPFSARPLFELPEKKFEGSVEVDGQINGYIKAGVMVSLEIFGWELVGAGVFIGAGVNISISSSDLNIELYGLVQVYVTFAGKTFNLIYARPTILKKTQKDMGGYRATIEESCAYRDIVVGFLQTSQSVGGTVKLQNAPKTNFQIIVTKALGGAVSVYPTENTYYQTDALGRFLVHEFDFSYNDKVAIQVIAGGKTFGPCKTVLATYPFKRIEITRVDGFNDWIIGQVDPVRVRNWDKTEGEEDYEILHFQGLVEIQIQQGHEYNILRDTLYSVHVTTDEDGQFRAENGHLQSGDPVLDIKGWHIFSAVIDSENALIRTESSIKPYTNFMIRRVAENVPGSNNRYQEGSKTIDQITVNERIYIVNLGGTRQLTDVMADCSYLGYSTQDMFRRNAYQFIYGFPAGEVLGGLFPAVQKLQLMSDPPTVATDGEPSGASYFDMKVVKEWVWPAHKNPTVITSPDHDECTTDGGSFQVTATGVTPFIFGIKNAPAGVSLLTDSGLMIIGNTLLPGVYKYTVRVTGNAKLQIPIPGEYPDYAEDNYPPVEQAFTLTVTQSTVTPSPGTSPSPAPTLTPTPSSTPLPAAPVITSPGTFKMTPAGGTFQVTATGTAPITFSISASPIAGLPQGITINARNGIMTVGSDRQIGEYEFYINAQNSAGEARQLFHLIIQKATRTTGLTNGLAAYLTARTPFRLIDTIQQTGTGKLSPSFVALKIPNLHEIKTVIRNDDPKDLYSTDMLSVFGADYVKSDVYVTFIAEDTTYSLLTQDESPLNDHHLTHLTAEQKAEIEKKQHELTTEYTDNGFGPGFNIDFGGSPLDELFGSKVFDYGGFIDLIKGQDGGDVLIDLTGDGGSVIPGQVFNALKEKAGPDTGLTLSLAEAKITFAGSAIGSFAADQLFDFAFSAQAEHETAMKQAAGNGAASFTYEFAHNGSLPGAAKFAISTGLAAGTKVNVYKFDAAAGQFALIAGGMLVAEDGVVTYMNNSTSEYLITTTTLNGAALTDAYTLYNNSGSKPISWLLILLAGGAVLMIGGVVALLLIKRKKKATTV